MPSITLKNPLDNFASYSIHHILLACRTTEEAKVFINESENGPTLAAIEQVKELGGAVPVGGGKDAYLVIDTRRFAQFSVEKLEYEVFINGLEKRGSHGNLATTISMTISDAVGISFINFIQWLMNEKMQTNFDGMIFMHRVLFVGHHPNGKTETVQSVTIPMHLFKMELSLDALKGTYDMQFMPNMNFDVMQHHRWLNIHNATRYFSGDGVNNLGGIIDSFESQLNKVSETYYDEVQDRVEKAGRMGEAGKYGRKVQYQITIPAEWRDYKVIGSGTANATETNFKLKQMLDAEDQKRRDEEAKAAAEQKKKTDEAAKAEGNAAVEKQAAQPLDTNVSVQPDRQITEVLDFIFKQVPQIADLGTGRKIAGERGSVTFYKHFVGITSDDQVMTVHVDVVPFKVPNLVFEDKEGKALSQSVAAGDADFYQEVGKDGARRPANYMEFDYIFTGKNKDVLNFDLKFQDLQWMLASQLNLGPGVDGVVENTRTGQTPVKDISGQINERAELITTRQYDAILVPRKTTEELENYSNYTNLLNKDEKLAAIKASNNYMTNLSMYYAMAPITAIMTIRGNPDIMTKFNQNNFLPHPPVPPAQSTGTTVAASANGGKHANYRAAFETQILRGNVHEAVTGQKVEEFSNENGTFVVAKTLGSANYASYPVFVTVNVMGPNVQHYPGQKVSSDFAERLLTDNYYVVFRVKNIIEGNAFTQELELYSHNIFGMGKVQPVAKVMGQ